MILQLVIGQRLYELVPVLQALLGLFIAAVATLDLKESGGLSHYLFSSARALFGSDRGGGKLFRLDILQGPAIILWHHLDEAGDGVLPIDRKSVVSGKSVSVRVDLGGRRIIKKKKAKYIRLRHQNKAKNRQKKNP